MVKICKACGYQNPDYARFCTRCGAPLADVPQQQYQQPPPQYPFPIPTPSGRSIDRSAGIWFLLSGIIGIILGILGINLRKLEGAEVAVGGLFIIALTYTLIMLSYKGFIKLNSKSLGRTIREVFYGGIIYTVLISMGTTELPVTARALGFIILAFIVMFLLMFIYGSGLIYVGAKNRLWMILVGGIVFLIYTISLVVATATLVGGTPIYILGPNGNAISLILFGVLMIVSYVVDFRPRS
jgi:hypothetical protein